LERGKCLRELKKYEESIADLETAVQKLGKSTIPKRQQAHAHNELGFSYHENGNFEKVGVLSIGYGSVQ
jgi:Flp pilus assembly protein TadD